MIVKGLLVGGEYARPELYGASDRQFAELRQTLQGLLPAEISEIIDWGATERVSNQRAVFSRFEFILVAPTRDRAF